MERSANSGWRTSLLDSDSGSEWAEPVQRVGCFILSCLPGKSRLPANHGLRFLFLEPKRLWCAPSHPVTRKQTLSPWWCPFLFAPFPTGLLPAKSRGRGHGYLLDQQAVAPYPLQKVTEAGDQGVLLQARDVRFPVAQFHCFMAHLLHQHAFGLKTSRVATSIIPAVRPEPNKSATGPGDLGSLNDTANCRSLVTLGKVSQSLWSTHWSDTMYTFTILSEKQRVSKEIFWNDFKVPPMQTCKCLCTTLQMTNLSNTEELHQT